MSIAKVWPLLLVSLVCVPQVAFAAPPAKPKAAAPVDDAPRPARLDTFNKPDGTGYFALSLMPTISVAEAPSRDVVVLFDTSASQTGPFREKAFAVLEEMLKALPAEDRVQLLAIDLAAIPLTGEFVSPRGEAMNKALAALRERVPLGSTDMPVALQALVQTFGGGDNGRAPVAGERARAAVIICDGMSVANLLDVQEFRRILGELAARRVAVSAMAIGPRLDANLLAALANQTGGMLVIDGESVAAQPAGLYLAKAVRGPVLWSTDVQWPANLGEMVQHQLPPLRLDRETVVIGRGKPAGECKVTAKVEYLGQEQPLSWTVSPSPADDDFAFLSQLYDLGLPDNGISLPTIGRTGLLETRRVLALATENLAELGKEAATIGNLEDAERLINEALRRDPSDPMAQAVKRKLADMRAAELKEKKLGPPAKSAARNDKNATAESKAPAKAADGNAGKSTASASGGGSGKSSKKLVLGSKAKADKDSAPAATVESQRPASPAALAASKPAAEAKKPAAQPAAKPTGKITAIRLNIPEGTSPEVAWNDYFAAHADVAPEVVRETARQLMNARHFDHLVAMIQAAIRAGQPQPWMYEAIGLALQAGGRPKPEIERALMSGVDFSFSLEDMMYVAQYMARSGLDERGLKVFRQVAAMDPLRPEPYLLGLQLAQRLNQLEGIQWSSLGILKQAWPNDKKDTWRTALRAAVACLEQLKSEKRSAEAAAFQADIDKALIRDCIVSVTWTGDADVDMYVEEPAGTICSFRNPRTTSGGIMMGDSFSSQPQATREGFSETYVCPQGFSGTYKVLLRRVWGKVTAGKVTVDVYSHYGTNKITHVHQQIPLADQDAAVAFDLEDGRRADPLDQQQVANAAVAQVNLNQAILAQQLAQAASQPGNAIGNLGLSRMGLYGGFNGPFLRGAVGYQPIIITLPTGANMAATGVISADRRYVRITALPLFSQIGQITTFNIASGKSGTSPTPPAGGGGVGAGGAGGGNGGGVGGGGVGGGAF